MLNNPQTLLNHKEGIKLKNMTKQQRRKVYWQIYCVLGAHDGGYGHDFLCHILSEMTGKKMDHFPELLAQKPKETDGSSWYKIGKSGSELFFKIRQEAVLRAIALTY